MRHREQGSDKVVQDWEKAGERFSRALGETALTLGGPEVAERIATMAILPDTTWPSAAAIAELERLHPGAAEQAMTLAEETQRIEHAAALAALNEGQA